MSQVVIVGSGVVGAAIAYELSKLSKHHITLIDKNTPASGSTGAALGVLMGIISQKTKGRAWRLRESSIKGYQSLIPELEKHTHISIPHNSQGIVMICFAEEDMGKWQNLADLRGAAGWPLEIWSCGQVQAKCPQVASDRLVGAVYSPKDLQINPTVLTQALVKGATLNGVNCVFGVEVKKIVSDRGRCEYLETSEGNIDCDYLVLCGGIGSRELSADLDRFLDIRPVLGQALQVKLDRPMADFEPVITGDDVHVVPLGNGEYWLGATVEFPTETGVAVAQPELLERVRQEAIAFCPGLKTATVVRSWSGKRPRPQNEAAPIIEVLSSSTNIIIATGHYRNGVLLAPATAYRVVELLQGLENSPKI